MSQRTYDALAPVYDAVAAPFEWPMVKRGLALLDVKEGERVLEVGHGTGRALEVLAAAVGPGGKVVGLDFSSGMARVASARLARVQLADRVELRSADVTREGLGEAAYDAIFSAFTVEIFEPAVAVRLLTRWRTALKPGGRVVLVNMAEGPSTGLRTGSRAMASIYAWAHRQFPAWVDCKPIDSAALLAQAGFTRITTAAHRLFGLPVAIQRGQ